MYQLSAQAIWNKTAEALFQLSQSSSYGFTFHVSRPVAAPFNSVLFILYSKPSRPMSVLVDRDSGQLGISNRAVRRITVW